MLIARDDLSMPHPHTAMRINCTTISRCEYHHKYLYKVYFVVTKSRQGHACRPAHQ